MAKWFSYDTAAKSLEEIAGTATRLYVLTSAIYSQGEVATHLLVSANVSAADFAITWAAGGPVLTVGAKNNQDVAGTGTSDHIALSNSIDILYIASCSARALQVADTANVAPWTITVLQSANNS